MSSDPLLHRNFISISPFPPKIVSGVTWRISFISELLEKKGNIIIKSFRWSSSPGIKIEKSIFWTKNRFLYLFDPKILFLIAKFRKKNVFLYCHTIWSGLYGLFGLFFFNIPFFFDDHNVEYDRFKSCHSYKTYFIFLIESILIHFSSCTIVSSLSDKKRIYKLYGKNHIVVIKNLFPDNIQRRSLSLEFLEKYWIWSRKTILFFGSFEYYPNQEALFFIQDYLSPHLDTKDYVIIIAGKGLEPFTKSEDDIIYLWFVEDIDNLILSVDLVIAPLFSWAGVKIKILHALSLGKYVLTTDEWTRGIEPSRYIIIGDKGNFLEKIQILLN